MGACVFVYVLYYVFLYIQYVYTCMMIWPEGAEYRGEFQKGRPHECVCICVCVVLCVFVYI